MLHLNGRTPQPYSQTFIPRGTGTPFSPPPAAAGGAAKPAFPPAGTIITSVWSDVTGDGIPDLVYLIGTPPDQNSPFLTNITLAMRNGSSQQTTYVPLATNSGYNPTLFAGDFVGDGVADILIRIDSGGSGAFTYDYIYSFYGGTPLLIFDYELYNMSQSFKVRYLDHYRLEVTSRQPAQVYLLDISLRGKDYLSEIYNPNGTLKKPLEGDIAPLSGLYPVDLERDGVYELQAYHGIIGQYNADRFGYIVNTLKLSNNGWQIIQQWASIFGADPAHIQPAGSSMPANRI
ncbi:VCBS repeat-containing protein [Paenibacillus sp. JX-17]|uniref:VCBS repeat-containing protein n=1 Tax=Paenibacillus lacisoli TaxID=3064525 RepID=A0ABT9CH56_9BACL|nr:VCBS repeat-containing protein [Paenibacillus sp. JX-17]MDO7908613.1 VCBS repeat-containing protein [Paenibacillus sp. JX-17]